MITTLLDPQAPFGGAKLGAGIHGDLIEEEDENEATEEESDDNATRGLEK